jgi:PPOX class probable F420-dependent enzyme
MNAWRTCGASWKADRMVRRNIPDEEVVAFLERPLVATLATYRKDGTVVLSPVWHEWRDGGFNIVVGADDVKARHLHRDPRVSVAVYESDPPYAGVEVRSQVTIAEGDVHELNRRLAIRYMGEKLGERYSKATRGEDRLWLRVEPGSFRSWDYTDVWSR